jgi:NTP pyrophosphatase (non-canonical NTP hydrolase)
MKKSEITIKNYQQLAMQTCLPQCKDRLYAMFGMSSEIFEMLGKLEGLRAKKIRGDSIDKLAKLFEDIKSEIGDVFWFTALMCELEDIDFAEVFERSFADRNFYTSKKFAYSDFTPSSISKETLIEHIGVLKRICLVVGTTPIACMRQNIIKLASRHARDVIKGNGDDR